MLPKTTSILIAAVALLALPATVSATTATRHQNPHLRVTVSLTPTKASVGQRLHITCTVTNTGQRQHRIEAGCDWEGDGHSVGVGVAGLVLQPHHSWTHAFTPLAAHAADYRATVSAKDRFGRSHAAATAS